MGRSVLGGNLLVLVIALAGCLGASPDESKTAVEPSADSPEIDGSPAPADDTGSSSAPAEPAPEVADRCEDARENVTALLEAKQEDPFGDRAPLEPQVVGCGDEGVFLLAAHGLEGPMAVQLTWSFPEPASCRVFEGAAAIGGHHRFHVEGWDHAEADPTVGFGTGGGAREVHAGPFDSTELLTEGDGRTAWAGSFEVDLAAGEHRSVQATNGWGTWENELTEGAALLHILVCDGSFTFQGLRTPSTLHLFSHHEMDQGAGARGPGFTGVRAGQALDVELQQKARLRAGAFAFEGVGAMKVADAKTDDPYIFGPEEGLRLVRDVPEGPLTVTHAGGGAPVVAAGAVYAGLLPTAEDAIIGGS